MRQASPMAAGLGAIREETTPGGAGRTVQSTSLSSMHVPAARVSPSPRAGYQVQAAQFTCALQAAQQSAGVLASM